MKKFIVAILSAVMAFNICMLVGCGNGDTPTPQYEKPVITGLPEDVTTAFTKSYTLPEGKARSKVDNRKTLNVAISCVSPSGETVEVSGRKISPTKLGTYTAKYNATDTEPSGLKADEVVFKVTFEDSGIIITEKVGASGIKEKSTYDRFAIPNFSDLAIASYEYKDLSNDDFNVVKTATYQKNNSAVKEEITDMETTRSYDIGVISVKYALSAKNDATIKKDYSINIMIGNVLLKEFDTSANEVETTLESITDKKVSDGEIIKFSMSRDRTWNGGKIADPSALVAVVNEIREKKEDKYLVINAYNPSVNEKLWTMFSVYDIGRYGGSVDTIKSYTLCYKTEPLSYFDIIVPINHFADQISRFEISVCGGALTEGGDSGNTLYMLGVNIVDAKDAANGTNYTTEIDINAQSTIKTFKGGNVNDSAVNATATYDETNDGIIFENSFEVTADKTINDVSLDLVSLNKTSTENLFLNTRHAYQNIYAVDVKNLGTEPVKVWLRLGAKANSPIVDSFKYCLNEVTIKAGETLPLHMNSATRTYETQHITWDFLNINVEDNARLLVSNPRIVNMPYLAYPNASAQKFTITKKSVIENYADKWLEGSDYTLPSFEQIFTSSLEVKQANVTKVVNTTLNQEVVFANGKISKDLFSKGNYEISLEVTEKGTKEGSSGQTKTVSFIASAIGMNDITEKPDGVEELKETSEFASYTIPSFDDIYDLIATHTSQLKAVAFSETENGEYTNIDASITLTGRVGYYKITYLVTITGNQPQEVDFYVNSLNGNSAKYFSSRPGHTFIEPTDYIVDGVHKGIIFDKIDIWNGGRTVADSDIIKKFNSLSADEGMKITVTNLSGKTVKTKFFLNDENNTLSQRLELSDGAEGVIYFKNTTPYKTSPIKFFEFYVHQSDAKLAISVDFVKDTDSCVALFDEANKGAEIAGKMSANAQNNAPSVTFANGEFVIDALDGDKYVNLLELGSYSEILKAYYANAGLSSRLQQVLAVDVTLLETASASTTKAVWFGAGVSANVVYEKNSRIMVLELNQKRTLYIPLGILASSEDPNYANAQVEDNFSWVKLNVENTKISASNFRVLNFAGLDKVVVMEKDSASSSKLKTTEDSFAIPSLTDIATFESLDLKNNTDFNIVTKASFLADGTETTVDITDLTTAKKYNKGVITIIYTVTAKSNARLSATFTFEIKVKLNDTIEENANIDAFKTTSEFASYEIPTFSTLYSTVASVTGELKEVTFSSTENGDYAKIDATSNILTGRVGFYKLVYVANFTNGATKEVQFTVTSIDGVSASLFTQRNGCPKRVIEDNVVDGVHKGVKFSGLKSWEGGKTIADSDIIKKFNSLSAGEGMKITVTNLSDKACKTRFFFNDQTATNSQTVELSANGEAVIYFKNTTLYYYSHKVNDATVTTPLGAIKILEFWVNKDDVSLAFDIDFVKDADSSVALFDEANKGAEIAGKMSANAQNNAPSVTFADGEFVIDGLNGDKYVNLLELGSYSDTLKAYYANVTKEQHFKQVLAVDVTLLATATDSTQKAVWLGAGARENSINDAESRVMRLELNAKRTLFIPIGILSSSSSNYSDSQIECEYSWVKLNVDHTKIKASNFRILNFAGMDKHSIGQKANISAYTETNKFFSYVIPTVDKIFNFVASDYTASVKSVEYKATSSGTLEAISGANVGTVLTGKKGFYKITYTVDFKDGTILDVAYEVIATDLTGAKDFTPRAAHYPAIISNNLIDGVPSGVKVDVTIAWGGAKTVSNSVIMNMFDAMKANESLKVTITNIGETAANIRCFFNNENNTGATTADNVAKNGKGVYTFKNTTTYTVTPTHLEFWVSKATSVIINVEIVKD